MARHYGKIADSRPWSAKAALNVPWAPGTAGSGTTSLGELVGSLFPGNGRRGRVETLMNAGGLTERIPSEGGFVIGEDLRTDLMLLALERAIIRPRALVVPMKEQRERIPVAEEGAHSTTSGALGGFAMAWVEEGSAPSTATPSLGNITLTASKLEGYTVCDNALFADSDKLDSFLRIGIPAAIAWYEDAAFIGGATTGYGSGTGARTPQGILNAPCAITVTRQTSSSVTMQDVFKMTTRLTPRSMGTYIWLASPDVLAQLLELYLNFGSATSGIVPPPDWLKYSEQQNCWTLLGRPFYATEHVNALGTQGDLVAVDPQFYVIGDRLELQVDVAAEGAQFIQDRSEIRIKERLDGRIWLASALTPANGSETVSPVVILK
jgi:HK97 family phage major capsid protein